MEPTAYVSVIAHEDGRVAQIVLDRPEALNAVSTDMARAIASVAGAVAADPLVRCVLLTSSHPKAFCVGADLKERNSFTDADLMAQRPIARAAYQSILDLPMPAIAVVDGFALGGGYELALSCDLIVVGPGAQVGLPEVSVGVIPGGGGTQLLVRRLGPAKAADLIFTARRLGPQEALEMGAVDRFAGAESGQSALELAFDMARGIAGHSPVGLHNAKRALRRGADVDLATGLDVEDGCWRATAFSGDRREGVAAFAEKRRPNWPGV